MMKMKTGLAAVAVASLGLWASAANAATLQIGAEANGAACNGLCFIAGPLTGGSPLSVATTPGGVPVGPFIVNASSTASSNSTALDFGSNTLDVTNNGTSNATLNVWVTLSNLTTG